MRQGSGAGAARLPKALPGFASINRYWDDTHGMYAAKLLPGEFYVTREQETIVTVLGSCVSACMRDPHAGIGGMNHFMLPMSQTGGSWGGEDSSMSTRYGSQAMERLISELERYGARRERLEVKLTGGGRVLANMTDVGAKNIEFVEQYVRERGLQVLARDLGDIFPRKVYYTPESGRLLVKKLRSLRNNTILEREARYLMQIQAVGSKSRDAGGGNVA